jgi:predicted transcriptional regulator of viral defense system
MSLAKEMSAAMEALARDRRRVLAAWRLAAKIREILPDASDAEIRAAIRRAVVAKRLRRIKGVSSVYSVELAYASLLPVHEHQVLQEANPFAALSHATALVLHGLTDQPTNALCASDFGRASTRIPLGTRPEDWAIKPAPRSFPPQVQSVPVRWIRGRSALDFGIAIDNSQNVPLWITDPERTILDCIRDPHAAGGFPLVAQTLQRNLSSLRLHVLLEYTERFQSAIMQQRVGFILEQFGVRHETLDQWASRAVRGGSMVLVPGAAFASQFSARWCLSLNADEDSLRSLE